MKKKSSEMTINIKDRIRELRRVPANSLLPNPKNWRTHPKSQKEALSGVLAEIGVADACLVRELPDGSLMLIDGHLRAETFGDAIVPVLILDVSEAEADKILATLDPIAAMAETNATAYKELLETLSTDSEALNKLITEKAGAAAIYDELADLSGDQSEQPRQSNVRMVQLFLSDSNIDQFHATCDLLKKAYSTANTTDTVLEAVKRASALL